MYQWQCTYHITVGMIRPVHFPQLSQNILGRLASGCLLLTVHKDLKLRRMHTKNLLHLEEHSFVLVPL